jgi:hypothetical protein
MSDDDILVSGLQKCRFFMPGSVRRSDDAPEGVKVEILATVSEKGGGFIDTFSLIGGLDPRDIADAFVENAPSAPLAVRVSGMVRTAFPDGDPIQPKDGTPKGDDPDGDDPDGDEPEGEVSEGDNAAEPTTDPPSSNHLAESTAPFNAVIFADADMLHDSVWAQQMRDLFGNLRYVPHVDNAALLVSALENLSGSSDLISLRSRAEFNRPFTRKEELLRVAQERYRAEELELEDKLAEANRRLNELQQEKDPANVYILSPEQEEEIANLRTQEVETRRKLRRVKRDLRSEIDALGTRLKLLNIFLIPAILAAAVAAWRLFKSGASAARKGGTA